MDFHTLVEGVLRREGGFVNNPNDRGGKTNFGISQRAHPDIDVANLTREAAKQIYYERYWNPLRADQLPEDVRELAFDTAVHHGVGRTRQWLRETNNNPRALLERRRAALQAQGRQPGQEQFLRGWMNRLAEFDGVQGLTPVNPAISQATAVAAAAQQTADAIVGRGIILPSTIAEEQAQVVAEEANRTGFLDVYSTALGDPRLIGTWTLLESMNRPDRDPEFSYWDAPEREQWEKQIESEAELTFLRHHATSREGAAWALARIQTRREMDREVYGRASGWANFFGQAAASLHDPVGAVFGLGLGKMLQIGRVGSFQLAAKGRIGAALGSAAAEGAAGNVAFEAIQDALGEHKTAADYAAAAALGTVFSGLAAPSIVRQGLIAQAEQRILADAAAAAKAEAEELVRRAAAANEQARADGLSAEAVSQAQGRELADTIDEGTTIRAGSDRPDRVVPDDLVEAERASDAPPAARATRTEAPARAAEEGTARVTSLPRELAGAKPRYNFGEKAFTLEFESDIDKALYIVAADRPSKRDGEYMAFLRQAALMPLTDQQIREFGRKVREQIKAQARDAEAGTLYIRDQAEVAAELSGTMNEAQGRSWRVGDVWANKSREGILNQGTPVSLRQALEEALESRGANAYRGAYNAIRSLLDNLPARVLDNTPVVFRPGIRGQFNLDGQAIATPSRGGTSRGLDLTSDPHGARNEAVILAHEAVHAATAAVIRAVREGIINDPVAVNAVKRLEELRRDLLAHLEANHSSTREGGNRGAWYAATGGDKPDNALYEFVAQAMTDRSTQLRLAELPGQGYESTSGWDRFKKAVRSLLGLKAPKPGQTVDAWSEAVRHIETLIDVQGRLPDDVTFRGSLFGPNSTAIDTRFSARMYEHAIRWVQDNPIDQSRLQVLTNKLFKPGSTVRDIAVSDGLKLAASRNPVANMIAGLVTEVTTGAAGRRVTAAIKKDMLHQRIVGNSIVDYHDAYHDYRARNGGSWVEDIKEGEIKRRFDREVYEEILHRRYDMPSSQDAAVRAAADAMEQMFQRSLNVQKEANTLGSFWLPGDSRGYVPQALDGDRLRNADRADLDELQKALSKHWSAVYGWDSDFTRQLAEKYIWRARRRAAGENSVDFVATEGSTNALRDLLEDMGLDSQQIDKRLAGAMETVGAQPQNKRRLDVNLLQKLPSGRTILDYYSTNVETMARQHANRVAGAAALAERNILGQRGVNNLLRVLDDAPPEFAITPDERAAAERVFSEFLGIPWHGERRSAIAQNLAGFTRLQRLGGLGFTQLAEMGNILHHLGLKTTLGAFPGIVRMISEIRKIRKGEAPDNPWLSSLEKAQGFDFGLANFRMIAALDAPDELLRSYGKGSDVAMRAIAAGNYAQNALSLFRGIHAAQHRYVAEHIVKKALDYIQAGATGQRMLDDMGINPEMAAAIRADLDKALIIGPDGKPAGFDISRIESVKAAEEFLQAVHRGTHQIIQGTFIGERGAWAHNDMQKLLFQLRTFGLTAMEKQWGRVRTIHSGGALNGYGYAAGVLIAQMALTLPIYLARVAVYSAGREDQEAFIERATSPASLVQAVMNYTAVAGLMGDAVDIVSSMAGGWSEDAQQVLGTRRFSLGVGGLVPAFGSIDQALRVASGRGDLHTAMKQLPFSNLPFIAPVINLVGQ